MTPQWHFSTERMRIRKVCVGPYENNAYVLACVATGKAVVIDAAADTDRLVAATAGLSVEAILTTHGHLDHVGAARKLAQALSVPFLLDPSDAAIAGTEPDGPLPEDTMELGDVRIEVRPTPGHTPGSTCFVTEGVVFSGDTLFPGGPGATRFPYSSFDQILQSIESQLLPLEDETIVMPGHGLDTTIGAERPAFDEWRNRGW